jgi:hypothetical protein
MATLENSAGRDGGVTVLCGVLAAVLAGPVGAAEVRIDSASPSKVVYNSKVGEVNTVEVTHVPGNAGSLPGSIREDRIEIKDSTAPLTPIPPCVQSGTDTVVCVVRVQSPGSPSVSLDLGNRDDRAVAANIPTEIRGGLGNDVLTGGGSRDDIDGGPGNDVIAGGNGDDVLKGGSGNDEIRGGGNADRIDGDLGDDPVLDGGPGDDVIHGGPGNDTLTGGAGSDQLFGDAGKDRLNSRDGETDALDCGTGDDDVDRDPGDTTKHCRR